VPKGVGGKEGDTEKDTMPGVIMESVSRNGSHTNHDRDRHPNGVNGEVYAVEKGQEKGKGRMEPMQNMTPISPTLPNGLNGIMDAAQKAILQGGQISQDSLNRIHDLPPEIEHITMNFEPLSQLLRRTAQITHNNLADTLQELAQMPVPASATNGNSAHTPLDDNSNENVAKKVKLLEFANGEHSRWVKALVITDWSRRAADVSKLIDLNVHMNKQKWYYDSAVHEMAEVKRGLKYARLPNPDLKTAVEVLTTGKANYMPDVSLSRIFMWMC